MIILAVGTTVFFGVDVLKPGKNVLPSPKSPTKPSVARCSSYWSTDISIRLSTCMTQLPSPQWRLDLRLAGAGVDHARRNGIHPLSRWIPLAQCQNPLRRAAGSPAEAHREPVRRSHEWVTRDPNLCLGSRAFSSSCGRTSTASTRTQTYTTHWLLAGADVWRAGGKRGWFWHRLWQRRRCRRGNSRMSAVQLRRRTCPAFVNLNFIDRVVGIAIRVWIGQARPVFPRIGHACHKRVARHKIQMLELPLQRHVSRRTCKQPTDRHSLIPRPVRMRCPASSQGDSIRQNTCLAPSWCGRDRSTSIVILHENSSSCAWSQPVLLSRPAATSKAEGGTRKSHRVFLSLHRHPGETPDTPLQAQILWSSDKIHAGAGTRKIGNEEETR